MCSSDLAHVMTPVGSVHSQGDAAMGADKARTLFEVDGTGVTVGVVSDSYDCLGGATGDLATGDLPPEGVDVLEEASPCDEPDEGRAMLQIVHDVAPGAALAFHAAFNSGAAGIAQAILELASAGADIIVDDVGWLSAPMF